MDVGRALPSVLLGRELGKSPHAALQRQDLWPRRWVCSSTLDGHGGCVNTVHFTSDGKNLLSGSDDRTVKVWSFSDSWTGKLEHTLKTRHMNNIFDVQQCPFNEEALLTSAADGCVCMTYMNRSDDDAELLFSPQSNAVSSKMDFQPSSPTVVLVPFSNGFVRLFDLRSCRPCIFGMNVVVSLCQGANDVKFDPTSTTIFAVASDDPVVRICDLRYLGWGRARNHGDQAVAAVTRWYSLRRPPAELRSVGISGLCWSRDGLRLLANYHGEDPTLFDMSHAAYEPEPVEARDGLLDGVCTTACVRSFNGRRNVETCCKEAVLVVEEECVATGGDCGSLYVWRTATGELVRRVVADRCVVNCVAPHPAFPCIATAGIDSDIKVWDVGDEVQETEDEYAKMRTALHFGNWNVRNTRPATITEAQARQRLQLAEEKRLQGNGKVREGRFEEASTQYRLAEEILSIVPPTRAVAGEIRRLHIALCLNLALCMLRLERYDEVVSYCDQVLQKESTSVKALFRRASALLKRKEFDAAQRDVAAGLAIEPRNTDLINLKRGVAEARAAHRQRMSDRYKKLFQADDSDSKSDSELP